VAAALGCSFGSGVRVRKVGSLDLSVPGSRWSITDLSAILAEAHADILCDTVTVQQQECAFLWRSRNLL
jgi:hypothetical protein